MNYESSARRAYKGSPRKSLMCWRNLEKGMLDSSSSGYTNAILNISFRTPKILSTFSLPPKKRNLRKKTYSYLYHLNCPKISLRITHMILQRRKPVVYFLLFIVKYGFWIVNHVHYRCWHPRANTASENLFVGEVKIKCLPKAYDSFLCQFNKYYRNIL